MRDKIEFFGIRTDPSQINSATRAYPSDSLQRLRDSKNVPGLIKQFSRSAPLAEAEVGE